MRRRDEDLEIDLEFGVRAGRFQPFGLNGINYGIRRSRHQDFDEMKDVRPLTFGNDLDGAIGHVRDITDNIEVRSFVPGEIAEIDSLHPPAE